MVVVYPFVLLFPRMVYLDLKHNSNLFNQETCQILSELAAIFEGHSDPTAHPVVLQQLWLLTIINCLFTSGYYIYKRI